MQRYRFPLILLWLGCLVLLNACNTNSVAPCKQGENSLCPEGFSCNEQNLCVPTSGSNTNRTESTISPAEPTDQEAPPTDQEAPPTDQEAPPTDQEAPPTENSPEDGGVIPEAAPCTPQDKRPCYPEGILGCTFDAVTQKPTCEGVCSVGEEICTEEGKWSGVCSSYSIPAQEMCNNLDDNCDGSIDEGLTRDHADIVKGGCKDDGQGNFTCLGECRPAKQECIAGNWVDIANEHQVNPTQEICDGKDNDCDGQVDEEITKDGASPSQGCPEVNGQPMCRGECKRAVMVCIQGQYVVQTNPVEPVKEICDGKDNDCDGKIDGFTEPCYTASTGCLLAADGSYKCKGACKAGTKTCNNGIWTTTCSGEIPPQTNDACTPGADDNCNGIPNEGCPCVEGENRPCYTGDPVTKNVGECKEGSQACNEQGQWGECKNQKLPNSEICDGLDNDCDGKIDEDGVVACYTGQTGCVKQANGAYQCKGPCQVGSQNCQQTNLCQGQILPQTEICDNQDNDCDGFVDNKAGNQPPMPIQQACYTGPAGTLNKGECKGGTQDCTNGNWATCQGEIKPAQEYIHCFDEKDNDCDGQIDFNDRLSFSITPADACTVTYSTFNFPNGVLTWRGIVRDNAQFLYLLGEFTGTIQFDVASGAGTTPVTLQAPNSAKGILVTIKPDGTVLGAVDFGGNPAKDAHCSPRAIGFHNNNIYVTGFVTGQHPIGNKSVGEANKTLAFALRFDVSTPTPPSPPTPSLVWAVDFKVSRGSKAYALAVDNTDLFIGGTASGTDFPIGDANPPTQTVSTLGFDPFLLKLDLSNGSRKASALVRSNGLTDEERIWSIKIDSGKNVIAAGTFRGTISTATGQNITSVKRDSFIAKWGGGLSSTTTNGLIWFTHITSSENNTLTSLAFDNANSIYAVGDAENDPNLLSARSVLSFRSYPNLPQSVTLSILGTRSLIALKLNSANGVVQWVRGGGDGNGGLLLDIIPNRAAGYDVQFHNNGVYVLGAFNRNFGIYSGSDTPNRQRTLQNTDTQTRLVLVQLDTNGNLVSPSTLPYSPTTNNPHQHALDNRDWFSPGFTFAYGVDVIPINLLPTDALRRSPLNPLAWKEMTSTPSRFLSKGIFPRVRLNTTP